MFQHQLLGAMDLSKTMKPNGVSLKEWREGRPWKVELKTIKSRVNCFFPMYTQPLLWQQLTCELIASFQLDTDP